MAQTLPLLRMRPLEMDPDRFRAVASALDLRGDLARTEEALALRDQERTLVYAQPGSRFAGVLLFVDQRVGVAQQVERVVEEGEAAGWAERFLGEHELLPSGSADQRVRVDVGTRMSVTNGVVFDGRERREVPVKADLVSRITVNDVPVTGPRAKVRMTFKTGAQPILLHRGLWERLEFAGELRVADMERVHAGVLDRLRDRRGGSPRSRILQTRLAYHAAEYTGGPDLLAPSYFVEVEHRAPDGDGQQRQQPRQVIRVPA